MCYDALWFNSSKLFQVVAGPLAGLFLTVPQSFVALCVCFGQAACSVQLLKTAAAGGGWAGRTAGL